jgi:hypothetical protein
MANDRNQTGDDVELVIDGEVVPVTDKGWTDTRDWAESNFDDSKAPDRGLSARSTEGDLEYDGTKQELERKLHEAPQNKHRLIFRNKKHGGGYRIMNVTIDDIEHSHPGDGKSNVSISWSGGEPIPF